MSARARAPGVSLVTRTVAWVAWLTGGAACLTASLTAVADADAIVGQWDTGDGAQVEIYERDGLYHGRFISFDEEPRDGGLDLKNPDPSLRDRVLLGTDFILDFAFDGRKWKDGRIYNPEDGKRYRADLELVDEILKVRGWIGFRLLGRTVEWSRLP